MLFSVLECIQNASRTLPRIRCLALASLLGELVLPSRNTEHVSVLQSRDSKSEQSVSWQGEELEPARKKAEAAGVKEIFIDDVREEFVREYVFPMFRCAELDIKWRVLFTHSILLRHALLMCVDKLSPSTMVGERP